MQIDRHRSARVLNKFIASPIQVRAKGFSLADFARDIVRVVFNSF